MLRSGLPVCILKSIIARIILIIIVEFHIKVDRNGDFYYCCITTYRLDTPLIEPNYHNSHICG